MLRKPTAHKATLMMKETHIMISAEGSVLLVDVLGNKIMLEE